MTEGNDKTTDAGQTTSTDDKSTGTFTAEQQKAIDRIVSQRVNETKASVESKFQGFEQFRDKAQVFDNMMDDERFQKFMANIDKHVDPEIDKSEIKGMEDLKRYDPDIASAVESIIEDVRKKDQKLYEKQIKTEVEPFKEEMIQHKAQRAVEEVEQMKADTEKYPYMQSEEFQGRMASLLTTPNPNAPIGIGNSPRAFSLEDAYDLAAVHAERDGMELPKSPSEQAKAKKDAELLEDRAGGAAGTADTEDQPPKFKDAREAAEWAMKKQGWM
jgi:hypothetical protein